MTPEFMEQYARQIEGMNAKFQEWRTANPGRDLKVQFNFPRNVMLVQPISDALRMGTVTANEAGVEAIKAMHPWGGLTEPTVFMVRVALEHEPEKAKLPEHYKHDIQLKCPYCRGLLDGSTSLGGQTIHKAGDYSVCLYCGGLICYGEGLRTLLKLTEGEILREDAPLLPILQQIQNRVREKAKRPSPGA